MSHFISQIVITNIWIINLESTELVQQRKYIFYDGHVKSVHFVYQKQCLTLQSKCINSESITFLSFLEKSYKNLYSIFTCCYMSEQMQITQKRSWNITMLQIVYRFRCHISLISDFQHLSFHRKWNTIQTFPCSIIHKCEFCSFAQESWKT